MNRQKILALFFVAAAASSVCVEALAQAEWKPQRSIEIIVPVHAGGGLDRPARMLQQMWRERRMVSVPVIVGNRPGGGQSVGLSYVHKSAGDPHRFVLMSSPLLTNYHTGASSLQYTDFTILGQLFTEYLVVAVKPDSPLRSAADLVARLKPAPDALSVAIGTVMGNTTHMSIGIPLKHAGVEVKRMKHVVFPSAALSVTAVLGGHVDVAAASLSVAAPHRRSGKLRLLAITAPKRIVGEFGDVPTWTEQGVDAVVSNWRFLVAPPGLTSEQVAWWDALFARTVKSPAWKKALEEQYWMDEYMPSGAARQALEQENAEARAILLDLGLVRR